MRSRRFWLAFRGFGSSSKGTQMAATTRRPLVAGNWKMNGVKASAAELGKIMEGADELWTKVDLMICPPATLVMTFAAAALGSEVEIGAQDCHAEPAGAFTGDVSAEMLADVGAKAIIVGHSERRTHHKETDADVRAKAQAVWRARLTAIVCIGENRAERDEGRTLDVLGRQIEGSLPNGSTAANLVIAYEPVWAIGTGLTPTAADVAQAHEFIRGRLAARYGATGEAVRVLYGGSVKASNARELMAVANVDGALVGGASLKADEFLAIAGAYREIGR
jgi:triosephosphate isomerase